MDCRGDTDLCEVIEVADNSGSCRLFLLFAFLDFLQSLWYVDPQQGDGEWKTEKEKKNASTSCGNSLVWLSSGEEGSALISFPNLDTVPAG
jgi:hypothetical protein